MTRIRKRGPVDPRPSPRRALVVHLEQKHRGEVTGLARKSLDVLRTIHYRLHKEKL
jgi:hypothetical protein